ncbi:MAG TPA: AbrB/MazE/SpoVT family DNA-binding domain-containing protein [Stellaceae bacterium]|nr:AbrB/MazE/SpoVT family DNA-binding domain-containing protein [Stellaceae bacterium]
MTRAIIGKWGKSLAVRLPLDIVTAVDLHGGERVDIETRGNDIIIRRSDADALTDAAAAAEEILAERENYSLGDVSIRELIDEGRRF